MIWKQSILALLVIIILISSILPNFAANPANQDVTVTVAPTVSIESVWNGVIGNPISLGTFNAIGSNNSFIGNETLRTYSNVPINVTVRVSGPLTGTNISNTFALTDFGYYNSYTSSYQSFSTTAALIKTNWAKAPKGSYNSIPVDLWLYVPSGQDPDTYNCTIIYSAIRA